MTTESTTDCRPSNVHNKFADRLLVKFLFLNCDLCSFTFTTTMPPLLNSFFVISIELINFAGTQRRETGTRSRPPRCRAFCAQLRPS